MRRRIPKSLTSKNFSDEFRTLLFRFPTSCGESVVPVQDSIVTSGNGAPFLFWCLWRSQFGTVLSDYNEFFPHCIGCCGNYLSGMRAWSQSPFTKAKC